MVRRSVAIVGGGIAGLAAAHRLVEIEPTLHVTLLDASSRLGGVLQTVHQDGFLLERAADNFITTCPAAIHLCQRIGFADQLVETNPQHRGALVVHRGRLREIPEGFLIMAPSKIWPVLSSPILSPWGKLRLAMERFVPRKQDSGDESLASFVTRRLGRETYERLVQPLVSGIYAADPQQLSLQATMPRFQQMEREHGSLIRAARRQQAAAGQRPGETSGARYSMSVAPRRGVSSLVEAVADRLPPGTVRLGSPVERLARTGNGWSVTIGGNSPERINVDALIVATPAHHAARLLSDVDGDLVGLLECIPLASYSIVSLGYRRTQIGHPLNAFGLVVPLTEGRQIASVSFSSVKYPGRAPQGYELLRVFIGGALQPELADLSDSQLRVIAETEVSELLDIQGPPTIHEIHRWPPTMPQYLVGHGELVADIESRVAMLGALQLAGNAYHGVGIPHCIQSGEQAAEQLIKRLTQDESNRAPRVTPA